MKINLKYEVSQQRLEQMQLKKCYAYQIYLTAPFSTTQMWYHPDSHCTQWFSQALLIGGHIIQWNMG
jgi:hypothetical protein